MAKNTKKSKASIKNPHFSMGEFVIYMAAFAVIGLFTLWVSFAAPALPATLAASPIPAAVGGTEVFTGCGYYPNTGTLISILSPYAVSSFGGPTDSNGCFDSSKTETWYNEKPGTYTVKAYQVPPGSHNGKQKLMASTSYVAQ